MVCGGMETLLVEGGVRWEGVYWKVDEAGSSFRSSLVIWLRGG